MDIVADLTTDIARKNLYRLLARLQHECPNYYVFVNKWHNLKMSPTSPRCVFYDGVFDVYLNSIKVFDYVLKREKLRAKSYLDTDEYMFDPQMVIFKCRLYAHKDRKRLL